MQTMFENILETIPFEEKYIMSPLISIVATALLHFGVKLATPKQRKISPDNVEILKKKDVLMLPLTFSIALLGLFIAIKKLNPKLVSTLLMVYFTFACFTTISITFVRFWTFLRPDSNILIEINGSIPLKLPFIKASSFDFSITAAHCIGGMIGLVLIALNIQTDHYLLNNVFAISLIILAIDKMVLPSTKLALLILCILFFYDIFWVFGTPVMITVAKNVNGPIKILFPNNFLSLFAGSAKKLEFSILGLGDIVLPGVCLAVFRRFDQKNENGSKSYLWGLFGYLLACTTGTICMIYFEHGQPLLLYISPLVSLFGLFGSVVSGCFKDFFNYSEEIPESQEVKQIEDVKDEEFEVKKNVQVNSSDQNKNKVE
eukprot:TRINITY_DN2064_c0_g2_i1.p1 TRINITY_DN2064_c0_g2~~TRINITY_DN2064_c0_g2_i1.p1  ORF type:complete len:385 (-),score=118.98 TRINITY_DN2064_c0_g2_i1:104-1222(-)